jgi:hypothetical protein
VIGPIQLLTLGLDEARVDEAVLAEFARLQDAGTVRVLDVLFLRHLEDGSVDTVERLDADRIAYDGALLTGLLTADTADDAAATEVAWAVEDVVPRGQVAALVLVEHLWAAPLARAMAASGGRLDDEFWLTEADRGLIESLLSTR